MCKEKNDDKSLSRQYPFLFGIWTGAIERPPLILNGAIRTAERLGLRGEAAQDRVKFEDQITSLGGRYAFQYLFTHQPDPELARQIWSHLPVDTQDQMISWGKGKAGEIVGGSMISAVISKQLQKRLPKRYVLPFMFVMSCQGSMASLWSHNWRGGPPPPSGGGSGLAV